MNGDEQAITDVGAWLRGLGLGQYAEAFAANDIDVATLSRLKPDDLRALGVRSIGHRRLLADAIASLAPPIRDARAEPQRRQLTVLFADLLGATQLSTELDPEDLRDVYRSYQAACTEAIELFGGYVAQLLGDGVVAYFGYPAAHEDDAERAARAGLELVHRVSEIRVAGVRELCARVGIATGVVVVGDVVRTQLREEQPVVGETPNLAARLQAMAPPGGVVLGERTRQLIGGALELADLGTHDLKGFAWPVTIWQVVGERSGAGGATDVPLVDREREFAALQRCWQLASEGEGRAVVVEGPPGIGKSRLVRAFIDETRAGPSAVLSYFCSPHHTSNSLYPVAAQLEHAAGIERGDDLAVRRTKLAALLGPSSDRPGGPVESIGSLVGLGASVEMTPQLLKERMFDALLDALEDLCSTAPLLAVLEDAHWIDPTTAEFFDRVLSWSRERPVLVVLTQRPGTTLDWAGGVERLELDQLSRDECAAISEHVAETRLPTETLESILDNADGVPLFVEELTKNVVELRAAVGASGERELRVPATLEDSLVERLDRLGHARALAQVASVLGRDFSREFLAAVAGSDPDALDEQLARLVEAGLLLRGEARRGAIYRFNHALVQQAAYGLLIREQRTALHARVVAVLERTDRDAVERTPELLARHCARAGLTEKAISYWRAAGDRAMAHSAEAEAITSYREALGLLARLEPSEPNRRLEIELLTALGVPLLEIHGVASPEPEAVYARARELAGEIGARRVLFPTIWGLAVVYSGRGEMQRAADVADELFAIASAEDDPELEFEAHHAAWVYDFFLGQLKASAAHVSAVRSALDVGDLDAHALLYGGHDPALCARNFEALLAWLRGREKIAAALGDETFELALGTRHLHSRVHCIAWGSIADQLGGRVDAVVRRIDTLRVLAGEHGFTDFLAEGRILGGWAAAVKGDVVSGLGEIEEGLALRTAAGTNHLMPYLLGLDASARAVAGEAGRALARVEEALQLAASTGEVWFEPELRRMRAALLHSTGEGSSAEIEEETSRAVDLARAQGSRAFERRARELLSELGATRGRSTRP